MAPQHPPRRQPKQKEDFNQIVSTFTNRFGKDSDDPEQAKVTEAERKARQATAAQGADQYYDFATSAYLSGWGPRFHYTPFGPSQSLPQALDFYEHRLASLLHLRPGMTVLDVGCGVGGPAREIARFTGCTVVGISINARQVAQAVEMTRAAGLSHRVSFVLGDFLRLPFPEGSFDAAYAIEATVHAPDLEKCYAGIKRVLKPGALFGLSEWVLTSGYDPGNKEHVAIRNRVERGNGVSNLQTAEHARGAMLDAGYELLHDEDYAVHFKYLSVPVDHTTQSVVIPGGVLAAALPDGQAEIAPPLYRPWWYPLEGNTKMVETWGDWWVTWRMTAFARRLCWVVVWVLETLRLYPKGTLSAMATLAYCVDSVVDGGKADIFSPCWWFIGRKALDGDKNGEKEVGVIDARASGTGAGKNEEASKYL